MREKKQFFIPKNYNTKFGWIPGVSGWQHLAFIPIIAIDYFVILHVPISVSNKIVFCIVALGVPWMMIATKPVRDNVSLYKHLYWRLKFLSRQRLFQYKKEGYQDAIQEKIDRKPKAGKETGKVQEIHPATYPNKGLERRNAYNSGQENDSTAESVSR